MASAGVRSKAVVLVLIHCLLLLPLFMSVFVWSIKYRSRSHLDMMISLLLPISNSEITIPTYAF